LAKFYTLSYESISVFDIFKIGVGPSSSHTLGPWRAAQAFIQSLKKKALLYDLKHVHILLYGSLAKTGRGHGTDIAIQLGLAGYDPVTIDTRDISSIINTISKKKSLSPSLPIAFDPVDDIEFLLTESLPNHPNALSFLADFHGHSPISETYYSVGGGFIEQEKTSSKIKELFHVTLSIPLKIFRTGALKQDFPYMKLFSAMNFSGVMNPR
jgi:L-serine dehydratase